MATYVKLRGLDRGKSAVSDGSATSGSYRGWRIKSALGPSVTGGTSVKGTLTIGAGNAAVKYDAKVGGVKGNSINVAHVDPAGNNVPLTVVTTYPTAGSPNPTITVNGATDGSSALTSTANQVIAAVNADPEASQYVTASAPGTGASVMTAAASAPLASGANGTGTSENWYLKMSNKATVVVDVDDPHVQRILGRHKNRYVSLGQQ